MKCCDGNKNSDIDNKDGDCDHDHGVANSDTYMYV